jgi:DNA-binding response OmpR family regulator
MSNDSPKGDILVIEDNTDNLRLLTHILTQNGYKVRPVTDGSQGLAAAQSTPPDLILLDIMMPGLDGYEVCEQLKADATTRSIPIVFISALNATEDKVKAFTVGGVDYITKPIQAQEVQTRVATHLALSKLQKQLEAANRELEQSNAELQKRNEELQEALDTIRTLSGLIPMCAWCSKKIEDENGEWVRVEDYIEERSEAIFTHGMCPDCLEEMEAQAKKVVKERRK